MKKDTFHRRKNFVVHCMRSIDDFISVKSQSFFSRLKIDDSFLIESPSSWVNNSSFLDAKKTVSIFRAVNDTAERARIKYFFEIPELISRSKMKVQMLIVFLGLLMFCGYSEAGLCSWICRSACPMPGVCHVACKLLCTDPETQQKSYTFLVKDRRSQLRECNRLEDDPPINAQHLLDEAADWLKIMKFEAPELAQF
ncbi:hypothetical protein AVEN_170462-1 [Araneus ventricosus]|uniref:Uncharacterized protein n=1 Tax=Araneus ventricosus TaxID=182803 RepID=A0A4Y2BZ39_ARAVE|nr:hypothetical protein AVEN_170462-1 [Araneus ventricosus]